MVISNRTDNPFRYQAAGVVSDLHMFCRRSHWRTRLPEIRRAAAACDLFVFNGDTFDFKWTELASLAATVDAAIHFLEQLAAECPDTHIHVNLGNHDHHHRFITALENLCARTPNLTWHPYFLRVDNTLFLHGDATMQPPSQRQLERYRGTWLHRPRAGRWKGHLYDVLFAVRVPLALSRIAFLPHTRTLRRLTRYLEDIGHSEREGIRHVYFGHTHVPVRGRRYRGVWFHNGGAPMRGMPFQVLRANL